MQENLLSEEIFEKSKNKLREGIHEDWIDFFNAELEKDYFQKLLESLYREIILEKNTVYPEQKNWFNVLKLSKENLKIIIIGQDPYHGENQAHGFSFSVLPGIKTPPSLKNMYKEIEQEFNIKMDMNNGTLTPWVEQGVMLLNAILTVRAKSPASHKDYGWNHFTDNLIRYISENFDKKIFFLWGAFAKSKSKLIDKNKHYILESAHPSPFSAYNGFFGNNHFILANNYLEENGKSPINWKI